MGDVAGQLAGPRIPLLFVTVPARHAQMIGTRIGFARQAWRIAIGDGGMGPGVIADASLRYARCQCRCRGSPGGGSLPVPHGPGLEGPGVPVASGQLIGHGCLLVRIGSIKQEPGGLEHGVGMVLTCAFDAPVQLENALLVLVQVAPGE